jgi:hypothetical protein
MGQNSTTSNAVNQENAIAQQQLQLSQEYLPIAQQQQQQSSQLYNLTEPGLSAAEGYYKKLSTGDPNTIQAAIAPATEKISAASEAAKQNILRTSPRGGEQNLALEQADISKASQIGNLATTAYTGSFPALASLAGEGVGLSLNEVSAALSALGGSGTSLSGAATTTGNVAQQGAEGKASTLGLVGSLAGAAGTAAGGGAFGSLCWVAESLWGVNDARTHVLRYWFTTVIPDSMLAWLYRRYGRRIARAIQKCGFARMVVGWLFNRLLEMAWRDVHDAPVIRWSIGEESYAS